jgi:hypothetical protein
MSKYRRRRIANVFQQRHPADCQCAWDHCGELDARRAARPRRHQPTTYRDDVRTAQLARSVGLQVRRHGP